MQIYHYDSITGEHLGSGQADRDQKKSGSFLIPAYSTPNALPEINENECAVFHRADGSVPRLHTEGSWVVVADYRGYVGFDAVGNRHEITTLDITPDESWTLERSFVFSEAVDAKKNEIESKRDASLTFEDGTVIASGATWQVDPTAMAELNDILTLSTALGAVPEGIEWRDTDNVNHPATLELLLSIAAARAIQKDAIWKKSWQLKAQVDALDSETATQADIDAIVVDFS